MKIRIERVNMNQNYRYSYIDQYKLLKLLQPIPTEDIAKPMKASVKWHNSIKFNRRHCSLNYLNKICDHLNLDRQDFLLNNIEVVVSLAILSLKSLGYIDQSIRDMVRPELRTTFLDLTRYFRRRVRKQRLKTVKTDVTDLKLDKLRRKLSSD